jgi:hypothetical protein
MCRFSRAEAELLRNEELLKRSPKHGQNYEVEAKSTLPWNKEGKGFGRTGGIVELLTRDEIVAFRGQVKRR